MLKKIPTRVVLLIIILLGLILRVAFLSRSPARLTTDEMSIGYNAYSILKTGKDEWGRRLPLSFQAFGDHKLPAYIYATVPFVSLFDLNPISIKIPSVIAGVLIIIGVYLIAQTLFKNKSISLLAALMVSINPWPIHLSRSALEANLGLTFFTFGLLTMIKSLKSQRKKWAVIAGVFFGLTFYSYVAYRLILVLLGGIMALSVFKLKKYKSMILTTLLTIFIVILPLIPNLVNFSGRARFLQVSIFTDPGVAAEINEDMAFCHLVNPTKLPKLCRLIFHKPQVWMFRFIDNYTRFILPTFLFIDGDTSTYLSVPDFGEYFIFLMPFYLYGLAVFLKRKDIGSRLVVLAFLLAPIPSALAGEPQIVRGSALIPLISIFIAQGLYTSYQLLNKVKIRVIVLVFGLAFALFSMTRYFIHYWFIYPYQFDNASYQMSQQVAKLLQDKHQDYDLIYFREVAPDPHIFITFYLKLDPLWYQENVVRPELEPSGFTHPIKLGKFEFGTKEVTNFICENNLKVLYLSKPDNQYPPTTTIYNFSKVHPQVKIYDVDLIRWQLKNKGEFETLCF